MKKTIFGIILILVVEVFACKVPIASGTMYFTPNALKMCKKWYYGKVLKPKKDKYDHDEYRATQVVCKEFEAEVQMQGSGRYNPSEIYTYAKEVKVMQGQGTLNCATAIGRSGQCLITYVSIAADARYYKMGDIISMPEMKGKKLTLPDGSIFSHPGYFRVDDVGGAIEGASRFDFYAGNMDLRDPNNTFGFKGSAETRMYDKDSCLPRKTYSRVASQQDKLKASKAIENSIRNISYNAIMGIKSNKSFKALMPAKNNKATSRGQN